MKSINYSLLPKSYDVYRVNQFYSEDKYYTSKNIKKVFVAYNNLEIKLYTLYELQRQKNYNIEQVVIGNIRPPDSYLTPSRYKIDLWRHNKGIAQFYDCLSKFPKLQDFYYFNLDCKSKVPTTGLSMLVSALANDYKEIFIAGIDLYALDIKESNAKDYPFNIGENMQLAIPGLLSKSNLENKSALHTLEIEIELINLALEIANKKGIKIYSVSKDSPINKYIPLATKIQNEDSLNIESKSKECIFDFVVPPSLKKDFTPKKSRQFVIKYNLYAEIQELKGTYIWKVYEFLKEAKRQNLIILNSFYKIFKKILSK